MRARSRTFAAVLTAALLVPALGQSSANAIVPPPPPNCSVDATIARLGGAAVGAGVIDPTGLSEKVRSRVRRGTIRVFVVDAMNTGTDTDPFILHATVDAPSTSAVVSDGNVDATADAKAGTYASKTVPAGTSHQFGIWMRPYTTGPYHDVRSVNLSISCKDALTPADAVIAEIKVRR